MTAWWRSLYTRFLQSPCRQLVVRVGRRGGKSSWACCFAVAFALVYSGLGLVPPGDVGWCVFVSVSKEEAQARLKTIRKILDAIRVKYEPEGDTLIIAGTNIGFRVQACTVASVSGWTSILVIADEVPKWKDRDTGANPATEVLAALRPTMAGQPLALLFLQGSPVGHEDAHAKAFERGDDEFQLTAQAATWIARPTLTEEETHRLEPDERVWRREYAAIPQGSVSSAFEPEAVEEAFRRRAIDYVGGSPVVSLDPAGRGSDCFAICAAAWAMPHIDLNAQYHTDALLDDAGEPTGVYVVHRDVLGNPKRREDFTPLSPLFTCWGFESIESSFRNFMSVDEIADKITALARSVSAAKVVTDQYESFSLTSLLERRRIKSEVYTWGQNKAKVVARLRQMLNERAVFIDGPERVKREMQAYEERVGANGITFSTGRDPAGGHFDHLSAILTGTMADMAGDLLGSNSYRDRRLVIG